MISSLITTFKKFYQHRIGKWIINILLILFIFQLALYWQTQSLLQSGQTMPDFSLQTLQGETLALKDLKGKRVIIHFWATWCPVCKTNIPVFNNMYSWYKESPVFISIVMDGERRAVLEKIVRDKGIQYPVLLGSAELAATFRISAFPTTYFVDENGFIRSQDRGFLSPLGLWYKGLRTAL